MAQRTVIIGVGNEYRGDDGAGPAVVHALEGKLPPNVEAIVHSGEATGLVSAWLDAALVILIDAATAQGTPGRIYRIEAHLDPLPGHFLACSTHEFGVAAAIELARALGELPPRVIVYGIEGQNFSVGVALSPHVARAVREVVSQVLAEI